MNEIQTTFISASKLGVLEHQLHSLILTTPITKRKRHMEFKRLARLVKDLKLIDGQQTPIGLSLGSRSDGELGLFVTTQVNTNVQGDIPK